MSGVTRIAAEESISQCMEAESRQERLARAVSAVRVVLAPHFDIFDTTERTNDIVQLMAIYRGDDPIGDIREMLEPKRDRPGIEFGATRAVVAVQCYRKWVETERAPA